MSKIRHALTFGLFAAFLVALSGTAFADNAAHTRHKHKGHAASAPASQTPAPSSDDTQGGGSAY